MSGALSAFGGSYTVLSLEGRARTYEVASSTSWKSVRTTKIPRHIGMSELTSFVWSVSRRSASQARYDAGNSTLGDNGEIAVEISMVVVHDIGVEEFYASQVSQL